MNIGYTHVSRLLALFLVIYLLLVAMDGLIVNILFFTTMLLAAVYGLLYKASFPKRIIPLCGVVLAYIVYGFGNPAWAIDSRYSLTWLIFLYMFSVFFSKVHVGHFIKLLFGINIIVFTSYLLSSVGLTFKLFAEAQADIPSYMSYRTAGFSLFTVYLLPFLYLLFKLKKDRVLLLNGVLGCAAIIINGSGQYFAIFIGIYILLYIQFRTFAEGVRSVFLIGFSSCLLVLYLANFADARLQSKYSKVLRPLEYPSVQARLRDFSHAINQHRTFPELLVGEGIGVRTIIYRYDPENPREGSYREFIEIDNGFYYIFHRFGLLGLFVILIIHIKLVRRIDDRRVKAAFVFIFLITNLLTIHYWTHSVGAILIGLNLAMINYKNVQFLRSQEMRRRNDDLHLGYITKRE